MSAPTSRADDAGRARRIAWRLWPFLRPQRRLLIASAVLMVLGALLALARPLAMKYGLDSLENSGSLWRAGLLLAFVLIGEQAILFPQALFLAVAGARGMAALREHVFAFLHTRRLALFDRTPTGHFVAGVTNDVDAVNELFASGALGLLGDGLRLGGAIVVMALIDWRLTLVAMGVVPPVALAAAWARRRSRDGFRAQRLWSARIGAFVTEHVMGAAVVQSCVRERESLDEMDELASHHYGAVRTTIGVGALMDALVELLFGICLAAVLWYSAVRMLNAQVTFGTMLAFVGYLDMFFFPIRSAMGRQGQFESALAGAERIFALLDGGEEDAPLRPASAAPAAAPGLALELDGVEFAYEPGTPVLHGVSLRVREGERVALVGATGSGKSTIASLLLRLYEPESGVVRVFGRDVRTIPREELRRHFAVVPQEVALHSGTVLSNIARGAGEPDAAQAARALADVGALELFEGRPGELHAPVLEGGSNLAVGERQMIAFARALYRTPHFLILDEPTASIDSGTEARLLNAVERALEGRTVLVIAHRLATLRSVDRIVVLHAGRVLEEGTHTELLALGGTYARFHRLQSAREQGGRALPTLAGAPSAPGLTLNTV